MLFMVKQWRVVITFPSTSHGAMVLKVHDNHYSNVLRKLADISFDQDPLSVTISAMPEPRQEGVALCEQASTPTS